MDLGRGQGVILGNQRLLGWEPDKAGSFTQKTGRGDSSKKALRLKINSKEKILWGRQGGGPLKKSYKYEDALFYGASARCSAFACKALSHEPNTGRESMS